MPPQHLAESAFSEGLELAKFQERHRRFMQNVVRRKPGATDIGKCEGQVKKRRRVKSYITMMLLDNALRMSADQSLVDFIPAKNAAGEYATEPFHWKHLSVSTDSGPDCVAVAHFLAYSKGLNLQWDFDASHLVNNSCKCALRLACFTFGASLSVIRPLFAYVASLSTKPKLLQECGSPMLEPLGVDSGGRGPLGPLAASSMQPGIHWAQPLFYRRTVSQCPHPVSLSLLPELGRER